MGNFRNAIIIFTLAILPFSSQARAADPAPAKTTYLPLVVLENSALPREQEKDYPLITLGSIPNFPAKGQQITPRAVTGSEQPRWTTFPDRGDNLSDIFAGKLNFSAAVATAPAYLLVAGPEHGSGSAWLPTDITLTGNTLTLSVSHWDANQQDRAKNMIRRPTYFIALGELPAGDYKFAIRHRHLEGQSSGLYDEALTAITATGDFTVHAAAPDAGKPLTIALDKLVLPAADRERAADAPYFIPPDHWSLLADAVAADKLPPTVQVGTYDAYKSLDNFEERKTKTVPALKAAADGHYSSQDFTTIITGPQLNSNEWIALREIKYAPKSRTITVTVDYFHDLAPRRHNLVTTPFIAIPHITHYLNHTLRPLDDGAGDYTLVVQWREFLAPNLGKPYELQPADALPKSLTPATLKFTLDAPAPTR